MSKYFSFKDSEGREFKSTIYAERSYGCDTIYYLDDAYYVDDGTAVPESQLEIIYNEIGWENDYLGDL